MKSMMEKKFANEELEIELTSYIDDKQNIWFRGKEIAKILGYVSPSKAIKDHVNPEDKCQGVLFWTPLVNTPGGKQKAIFINESGFYFLVISSKLETAKKFKYWVTSQVLPSVRNMASTNCLMIMIGNETDLHYEVVDLIRKYYPGTSLGENQDTDKRLDSYKKGYARGQPDLMILDYHKAYKGLCIEFKSPTNNYHISETQKEMKRKYKENGYAFVLSNDYDKICMSIHDYMKGIRVPCKYCSRLFFNKDTLNIHYRVIHKISN